MRYSIMVFVGLFSIVAGLVVFFLLADGTRKAILKEIVIDSEDHKNFEDWKTDYDEDDRGIYFKYWVWNLTNAMAFAKEGAKPIYEEVGPFTYRRYENKTNISFIDGGNAVEYRKNTQYIFQRDMSAFDDQDVKMININPWYVAAVESAGGEANLQVGLAAGAMALFPSAAAWNAMETAKGLPAMTSTELDAVYNATTGTASTIVVGLYVQYANAFQAGNTELSNVYAAGINQTIPDGPTAATTRAALGNYFYGSLGASAWNSTLAQYGAPEYGMLFREENAHTCIFGPDPLFQRLTGIHARFSNNHTTAEEVGEQSTVKTGKNDDSLAGMDHFTEVSGISTSTAYQRADGSGPVTVVNGRVNTMEPFQGATPDKIQQYLSENERYATFTFNGVQKVEGIETARYLADTEKFTATNADFNITHNGFCPMAYWISGAPIFLSVPHHRDAEAPYENTITGQSYNADAHDTFLDLEPITGLPLEAQLAIQLNVQMNFTANTYRDATNVTSKDLMIPLHWMTKSHRINKKNAASLRKAVVDAVVLRRAILGSLVGLGVVFVLIGAALMVQRGGNEGGSDSKDGAANGADSKKKNETVSKQQESELPPDNEPELQPFHPPPAVAADDEQEMDGIGPK